MADLSAVIKLVGTSWTLDKYDIIEQETKEILPPAINYLTRELKQAAPVATGHLQDSIQPIIYKQGMGAKVVVGNKYWQAIPIDSGAKASFQPIQPLIRWVEVKLGISGDEGKRVAHAIATDHSYLGMEPAKFWWATWDRLIPDINAKYLDGVGATIINKMKNKSAKKEKKLS